VNCTTAQAQGFVQLWAVCLRSIQSKIIQARFITFCRISIYQYTIGLIYQNILSFRCNACAVEFLLMCVVMEDVIFFIKSLTEHNLSLILMNSKKK
jgi:hypothetical protein